MTRLKRARTCVLILVLLLTGAWPTEAPWIHGAYAQSLTLALWPQLAGVKVRPTDAVPATPGTAARAKGGLGEGVATQVVLTNTGGATLSGLTPQLGVLTGPNGATIGGDAVELYRVGYVWANQASDPAGATGEWPDALYPIGPDRFFHEQRNGAPFDVGPGRNQPVWIDIRVPTTAAPGTYNGTFSVSQSGAVVAQLPFELTVWNYALPSSARLPTTYIMNTSVRISSPRF